MNEVIRNLYTCCCDNSVFVFETNLKEFHKKFNDLVQESHGYRWFGNQFKESLKFDVSYNGKLFTFQKLI